MKVGFFEEAEGVKSSARLMSFLSFFVATAIGILYVAADSTPSDAILIFWGFLIGAFAPKLVQKFAEEKVK